MATTSKRHGGSVVQPRRKCCAAKTTRRCLAGADAGGRAAVAGIAPRPHLDEDQGAVAIAQDQVDLAAARARAAGDPIIAPHQRQAVGRQVRQRPRLGPVSRPLRRILRVHPRLLAAAAGRRGRGRRAAVSRGRAVRGRHADRQPRRPEPARDPRAGAGRRGRLRGHAPQRTAAAPARPRQAAARAAPAQRARGRRRRCWRGWRAASAWPTSAMPARPALSDPGAALVAAAQAAGYRTIPLPGASSAVAALSVAGDTSGAPFSFVGFLPARGGERTAALARWPAAPRRRSCSRRRIASKRWRRRSPSGCGARRVTVCRELTKQFETVETLEAQRAARVARRRREPPPRRIRAGRACAGAAGHRRRGQPRRDVAPAARGTAAETGGRARRRAERRAAQCALRARARTQGAAATTEAARRDAAD